MRRIRIVVAYDGTNYCGWQIQPNGITIEEILNRQISKLTGEDIRMHFLTFLEKKLRSWVQAVPMQAFMHSEM